MLEGLKDFWLHVLRAEYASSLEVRLLALEAQVKAMNETKIITNSEKETMEEVRPRLSRPWPQRRTWLEVTDGGRTRVARKEQ